MSFTYHRLRDHITLWIELVMQTCSHGEFRSLFNFQTRKTRSAVFTSSRMSSTLLKSIPDLEEVAGELFFAERLSIDLDAFADEA